MIYARKSFEKIVYENWHLIFPFLFCRGRSEHNFEDDKGSEAIEERDIVQAVDEQPQPQDVRKVLECTAPEKMWESLSNNEIKGYIATTTDELWFVKYLSGVQRTMTEMR